jgi:hypothetical protein
MDRIVVNVIVVIDGDFELSYTRSRGSIGNFVILLRLSISLSKYLSSVQVQAWESNFIEGDISPHPFS